MAPYMNEADIVRAAFAKLAQTPDRGPLMRSLGYGGIGAGIGGLVLGGLAALGKSDDEENRKRRIIEQALLGAALGGGTGASIAAIPQFTSDVEAQPGVLELLGRKGLQNIGKTTGGAFGAWRGVRNYPTLAKLRELVRAGQAEQTAGGLDPNTTPLTGQAGDVAKKLNAYDNAVRRMGAGKRQVTSDLLKSTPRPGAASRILASWRLRAASNIPGAGPVSRFLQNKLLSARGPGGRVINQLPPITPQSGSLRNSATLADQARRISRLTGLARGQRNAARLATSSSNFMGMSPMFKSLAYPAVGIGLGALADKVIMPTVYDTIQNQ